MQASLCLANVGALFEAFDAIPLVFAVLLGGLVGLEREMSGRPAGLRTHVLVCVSATMLIMMSQSAAADGGAGVSGRVVFDPNRMGAGIVTGIGFLGAATVLRSGDVLRGLTTAACIWFVAGLGIVLGYQNYALGIVSTAIALFVLTVLNRMTSIIEPVVYRRLIVLHRRHDATGVSDAIGAILKERGVRVLDIASGHDNDGGVNELVFFVSLKNEFQAPELTETVAALDGISSARWLLIEAQH